jgi:hypothetical protein
VALVFLAGHGVNDSGGVYYYLPGNTDLEKLKSKSHNYLVFLLKPYRALSRGGGASQYM